jgi:hypothetical protein
MRQHRPLRRKSLQGPPRLLSATARCRGEIVFKNYTPTDSSLGASALPDSLSKSEMTPAVSLKAQIAAIEESDQSSERAVTLAPKKDTWDLKREMGKKLKALDKMTDAAIRELLKAKVAEG